MPSNEILEKLERDGIKEDLPLFRGLISEYGVDKVMAQLDNDTFWALWQYFKNRMKHS